MEGGVSGFPRMMVVNSQNYVKWKIKMEDILIVKDLYKPIERAEISSFEQKGGGHHQTVRQCKCLLARG